MSRNTCTRLFIREIYTTTRDSNVRFAYKHDLEYLVGLLPTNEREKFDGVELEWLSGWATEGRYPSEAGGATREDAQRAIRTAEAVYSKAEFAFNKLGKPSDGCC